MLLYFRLVALISLLLAMVPGRAFGISAGEIRDLKVVSHHFSTEVSSGTRLARINDPAKSRYLILKLRGVVAADDAKVFNTDFVLKYEHRDGSEDRARCTGIGNSKTDEHGLFGRFAVGNYAWIKLKKGKQYFGISCAIEPDVKTVEIMRFGGAPLTYTIGSSRAFSVFLTTNRGVDEVGELVEAVKSGGYDVATSDGLVKNERGITIHYGKYAETAAREISQRLMIKLKKAPVVKEKKLVSSYDVVIWIGQ